MLGVVQVTGGVPHWVALYPIFTMINSLIIRISSHQRQYHSVRTSNNNWRKLYINRPRVGYKIPRYVPLCRYREIDFGFICEFFFLFYRCSIVYSLFLINNKSFEILITIILPVRYDQCAMAYLQDEVAHGFWVNFIVWQPLSEQMEDMPVLISQCLVADLWLLYGSLYTCSMYWMFWSISEINHPCSVRGWGCLRPSSWTSCMKVKVTLVQWSGSNAPHLLMLSVFEGS